jgi:regulator of protease activity HflC (stomatin/prohibitin superfamily)
MQSTIPPPREAPIQGRQEWFTRTWWRFFSHNEATANSAQGAAEAASTAAAAAQASADNASAAAAAAQVSADNAAAAAVAAAAVAASAAAAVSAIEDVGSQALLRPMPVVPSQDQLVWMALMARGPL